jgi:hypothetical protein
LQRNFPVTVYGLRYRQVGSTRLDSSFASECNGALPLPQSSVAKWRGSSSTHNFGGFNDGAQFLFGCCR